MNLSPIARKQRALYGADPGFIVPRQVIQRAQLQANARRRGRLGYFGIASNPQAGSSVYSGPPVGAGAGGGAKVGAVQGASVGAVAGPIGMAIGAAIGAVGGAIAGALGKKDPEQANFDQAVAIYNANPQGILALVNKYLPLAGLFDLNIKTNIPIYKRYGRMGEQKFLADMSMLIYNAAQSGKITANDTPQTIMVKVVQPWIDSFGFGPMSDPHQDMINMLLMGLIIDYVTGNQKNWKARSGDFPFGSLPDFSLPAPVSAPSTATSAATSSPTPGMSVTPVQIANPIPANVLSTDGSAATPGSNTALKTPGGQFFYFGGPALSSGDYPVYANGQANGVGGIGLVLLNGGHLYLKTLAGDWRVWSGGSNWSASADPTTQTGATQSPSSTTVTIPAGFSIVAADAATKLPIYGTVNGGYLAWDGTTMTPFTGTLTNGLVIQGGAPVASVGTPAPVTSNLPSLTTGSQQLFNSSLPPLPAPADTSVPTQAPAPAAPQQVATAGVSGAGLPSWAPLAAIAGVAALMFATARPVGKLPAPRR